MRIFLIIILISIGLVNFTFGQKFIPVIVRQPEALTASAGKDTIVCTGHPVRLGGNPSATGGSHSYLYIWNPADGLNDPTSSNPVATIRESRTYILSVVDTLGCQAVSSVSVRIDACTGIDENTVDQSLTIFPNPSNGIFLIQGLSSLNGKLNRIEVLNELGQIVFSRIFDVSYFVSDFVIDTKIKEPGIYFLKVSLSDRIVSKRLIVR
jgi:hypothetical protein